MAAPTLNYFRTDGRVAERVIVLDGQIYVEPVTDRDLLNAARNALNVLAQWQYYRPVLGEVGQRGKE